MVDTTVDTSSLGSSWHSYPSIYNLGHRAIAALLDRDVLVEEKVDGSQFSFGYFPGTEHELRIRSKGAEQYIEAPEGMFKKAAATVKALHDAAQLVPGFTYRGEYLAKAKHNALAYDRHPANHIILFDIEGPDGVYLTWEEKAVVAARMGLEVVPRLFEGRIESVEQFRTFLENTSVLGGQKIEGVVVKPLDRYGYLGIDKKPLLGKFVSEAFREVHKQEWTKDNPTQTATVALIAAKYTTPARWAKAVQHLRDTGVDTDTVKAIGPCMASIPADVLKECREEIMDDLFKAFWPEIRRRVSAGFPEWFKDQLMRAQFEEDHLGVTRDEGDGTLGG